MKQYNFILSDDKKSKLDVYLHDVSKEMPDVNLRPFVLVFPGGGYSFCSHWEGDPVAFKYLSKGYHSGVLNYRVGDNRDFQIALHEASESIRIIREHAVQWSVDPDKIYVIGFSAGGHLAAAVSNLGTHKPNACILGYPALLGSFSYLMRIDSPAMETCVTKDTPPTFIFTTFGDDLVPVENTIKYITALENHEVPFEAHIFEKGPHGLSVADASIMKSPTPEAKHYARWFDMSVSWLRLQSEAKPAIPDNAVRYLMEKPELRSILLELIPMLDDPEIYKVVRNFPLKRVLEYYYDVLKKEDVATVQHRIQESLLNKYL